MDENINIEALQKAMAIIIAEHELMRKYLVDKQILLPDVGPCRWVHNGEPIINLEETIARHMREKNG